MPLNLPQILSVIEIVIILSAAIIALKSLRENARVRRVEVLGRVFDYYSSPEVRTARKAIRNNSTSLEFEKLRGEQLHHIELVLLSLSQIGFFIRLGIFNRKERAVLFQTYGESMLTVWDNLKPYVEWFRSHTKRRTSWCNLDFLIEEVRTWQKNRI